MTTMPEAADLSAASQSDDVLLEVRNLKMHFPGRVWISVQETDWICKSG